jgi:hypothetical protein
VTAWHALKGRKIQAFCRGTRPGEAKASVAVNLQAARMTAWHALKGRKIQASCRGTRPGEAKASVAVNLWLLA